MSMDRTEQHAAAEFARRFSVQPVPVSRLLRRAIALQDEVNRKMH